MVQWHDGNDPLMCVTGARSSNLIERRSSA
jgi:hypothetical protein